MRFLVKSYNNLKIIALEIALNLLKSTSFAKNDSSVF